MPSPPTSGRTAAGRIAETLGTPDLIGENANVSASVVRVIDRGQSVVEVAAGSRIGRRSRAGPGGPSDVISPAQAARVCGGGVRGSQFGRLVPR
jgi:hypothetical protein